MKSERKSKIEILSPDDGAEGQKVLEAWLPKTKVINEFYEERASKRASFGLRPDSCSWCEKFEEGGCLHCLNCGKVLTPHTDFEHYKKSKETGGHGVGRV